MCLLCFTFGLSQLEAVVLGDHGRGLLADHDARRLRVARDDLRHDAGISDTQTLHTLDLQIVFKHVSTLIACLTDWVVCVGYYAKTGKCIQHHTTQRDVRVA